MHPKFLLDGDKTRAATWIPWSAKRLAALANSASGLVNRWLSPADGIDIHMMAGPGGSRIRITASVLDVSVWSVAALSPAPVLEYSSRGLSGSVSGGLYPSAPSRNVTSTDGSFKYWVTRVGGEPLATTIDIGWGLSTSASPYAETTSVVSAVSASVVTDLLIKLIKRKEAEIVHNLLNASLSPALWARHQLAVARFGERLFFKQFNPPAADDVMYPEYQEVVGTLIGHGYIEVPADKFILETQNVSPGGNGITMLQTLGILPPNDDSQEGISKSHALISQGNYMAGVYGAYIDDRTSFLGTLGDTDDHSKTMLDHYKITYDPIIMGFVKESRFSVSQNYSYSLTMLGGPSVISPGVIFADAITAPIYYMTFDGPKTNSRDSLYFTAYDFTGGVPDGSVDFNLVSPPSAAVVINGDPSGATDRIGRWRTGAGVMDVYANGEFRESGVVRFTVAQASMPQHLSNKLPSFRWAGQDGSDLYHPQYGTYKSWEQTSGYAAAIVDRTFIVHEEAIVGIWSSVGGNSIAVGEGETPKINFFATGILSIRWPRMRDGFDGVCTYQVSSLSSFQTLADQYFVARRLGVETAEELAARVASARALLTVLYNNFLSDEALVVITNIVAGDALLV